MTIAIERTRVGRTPFTMVELQLDYCQETIGISPCTAARVHSGTVQSATADTVELDSSASSVNGAYDNYAISIPTGTGSPEESIVDSYVGATRIATMKTNWGVTPDVTSGYDVINRPAGCYNTRKTCQDPANYNPSSTTNTILLTDANTDFPFDLTSISGVVIAIPCLKKTSLAPSKINLGKSIGSRASIKATFKDFPHHDRSLDKYATERTTAPSGTFFGRLINRNRFYQGRLLIIHTGYLDNGVYDSANFVKRTYVIENIKGPDKKDNVTIIAKDILKLTDDERSVVPTPTTGALTVALTDSYNSEMELTSGTGSEYGANGHVRINGEIIAFISRTSDNLESLVRGEFGTEAKAHKIGDAVQLCKNFIDINVTDIVDDLLTNFTNIPAAYIDSAGYAAEEAEFLSAHNFSNIISTPTGVNTILSELAEVALFYIYWDEINQLIKLKAIAPRQATETLTDNNNFIAGTVDVADDPKQRVSQVWVYYDPADYTETDIENMQKWYIQPDLNAESTDEYGEKKIKKVVSRWLDEDNLGQAIQLAGRTLAVLRDNPRVILG